MVASRNPVGRVRCVVLKIGSRALASDRDLIPRIAKEIAHEVGKGKRFVVVSSGAIALGFQQLGYKKRPKEMAALQASAAVGQTLLMQRWSTAFEAHHLVAAQVLLTHADLADRERLNNARQALAALLDAGAIPVINENDTVATEEIRFGDNDQLAAMVTPLVGAGLLLLLSDVDGVLNASGKVLRRFDSDTLLTVNNEDARKAAVGSGGIQSKIDAARKASRSGAAVVIGNATQAGLLRKVLQGKAEGTYFPPHPGALNARKHWIAFTLRPRGVILIDAGAAAALRGGRSGLSPVGVLGVRGQFSAGDSVSVVGPTGQEVGRGLSRLGALELAAAAGRSREELQASSPHLGPQPIVVHQEDWVITE